MAFFLAVANRKGGVGKSTISVMLAQAYAAWGKKRVLVLDLDAQCNASLILQGGEGWREARTQGKAIEDYFLDLFDGAAQPPREYLSHEVGGIIGPDGKPARISILTGSLMLEDVQNEIVLRQASHSNSPRVLQERVRGRIEQLLQRLQTGFDLVILDCAPGLSAASQAAIKMAGKVLVPFRPDYVSQFAVDRIAQFIEGRMGPADFTRLPKEERRYLCVTNYYRDNGRDGIVVDTIAFDHPMLETRLPQSTALADAFDYTGERVTIEEKYGDAHDAVRALFDEMRTRVYA